jgi:hypothetical protein
MPRHAFYVSQFHHAFRSVLAAPQVAAAFLRHICAMPNTQSFTLGMVCAFLVAAGFFTKFARCIVSPLRHV